MKIVREDMKEIRFGDVAVGSVFIEYDVIFMKTLDVYEIEKDNYEEEYRYKFNAVNLGNGEFHRFVDGDMVKACKDAYLTVK